MQITGLLRAIMLGLVWVSVVFDFIIFWADTQFQQIEQPSPPDSYIIGLQEADLKPVHHSIIIKLTELFEYFQDIFGQEHVFFVRVDGH